MFKMQYFEKNQTDLPEHLFSDNSLTSSPRNIWFKNFSCSRYVMILGSCLLKYVFKIGTVKPMEIRTCGVYCLLSHPVHFRKLYWNKNYLNFYFNTSLWCFKRFYEGLIKPFEAPQRSLKKKFMLIFSLRPRSWREGLRTLRLLE